MIRKIGSLVADGGPILVDRIITNSVVVAISDSVKTASGFVALGTTGARVLGHVESFIGADGLTPTKDGTLLQNPGATFTAASDNQTVAKVRVRVDVSPTSLYTASGNNAFGTTTGSDLAGKTFDINSEDTIKETTVLETTGQYYSHGLNPSKTADIVVNILESEVFGF